MIKNYLKIAWKVLRRKKLYTAISLFGISFTLMFLILINAFYHHLVENESPRTNFDRVVSLTLTRGTIYVDGVQEGVNNTFHSYQFLKEYVKTLETPERVSVISFSNNYVDIYNNQKRSRFYIKYTDNELWNIADYKFIYGRGFNKQEFENGDRIVVIDQHTADILYPDMEPIGKEIKIKNRTYTISGVIENVPLTRTRLVANIYIPATSDPIQLRNELYGDYTALILAKNKNDFKKINDEFQSVLRKINTELKEGTFKLNYFGNADNLNLVLKADIERSFYTTLQTVFNISKPTLKKIVWAIVTFLLIVYMSLPSINLINININRIYERSSEIGSRMAFGATSKHIATQYLIENIFLTILGGILGFILASIIVFIVNKTGVVFGATIRISFTTTLFSLGMILLLGFLSGVVPAWRMSKMKIVESLKQDEI